MRLFLLFLLAGVSAASNAFAQGETFVNDLGMVFVRIEPGTMRVGRFEPVCPDPETHARSDDPGIDPRARWTADDYARCEALVRRDARPGFVVAIDRPFYIKRFEVTQDEWTRVMGTNPSYFQGDRVAGDAGRHPVEHVTWDDAQAFVRRLNALDMTGVYRLPTAFEWEYAARAGADEELAWDQVRAHAWIQDLDRGSTHPVGLKQPNAWGLYDMLGNVWEWVDDFYNERLFPDPVPPDTGTVHVLRGGSFLSDVKNATYFWHGGGPGNGFDVGFRVVREAR